MHRHTGNIEVSSMFGPIYAHAYDTLYRDKDYLEESALIQRLFQQYHKGSLRTVLDLGCGTGNHALPLCRAGYEVVGVDFSEDMLAEARRKATEAGSRVAVFHHADIRSLELKQMFDAGLMMFAVLGYQLENADVLAALKSVRSHLRRDGLLLFDVWYGPAVLTEGPSQRVKVIPTDEGQVLRVASGRLDGRRQVCTVRYQLWELRQRQLVSSVEETHRMRYFFPLELEFFLECAGFRLRELRGFPDFDRPADETTWNVMGVASAV